MSGDDSNPEIRQLVCLRHGESTNVVQRQAGALPDAALTGTGQQQALITARRLIDAGIDRVFASTALRAAQTADLIAAELGLGVELMPELGEVWLGADEGSTDDDVHAQTAEALHAWIVRGDLTPRFASGESGYDVVRRMSAALEQIANISTPGSASLVVGHVASLTATISHLCRNGATFWGRPLPHATPFPVIRTGTTWSCHWP